MKPADKKEYRDRVGAMVESMFAQGASLTEIAATFRQTGVLTMRGTSNWTASTVRGLLPVGVELKRRRK